jgi:organic radical activating enzyme
MSLNISETFYSVQAEGITSGMPSVFIRCQNCNLMCGGPKGSLIKQGKATWWCDSETVWRGGKPYSNEELEQKFIEFNQLENILQGTTHLIWTGGEPTIPNTAKGIKDFLDYMHKKYPDNKIYSEIETNGSLELIGDSALLYNNPKYINQINCSAKLANSGMGKAMRINSKAIEQIKQHSNYWFKIVVSSEEDVQETLSDYIEVFNIPKSRLIIMPGVDCLEDLSERTRFVYEMAKKYNIKACTRGQVLAWDRVTGV